MADIVENASLELKNVFSYRGKVTQQQLMIITKEMNDIITANNAKKTMPGVSATFGIISEGSEPLMDMEIMFPLDKEIDVPDPYTFKPLFRLRNAVKIRHVGNPALIQESGNQLMKFIDENGLMPITAGYNVTIQEPQTPSNIDDLIIDLYIGVSDNIL